MLAAVVMLQSYVGGAQAWAIRAVPLPPPRDGVTCSFSCAAAIGRCNTPNPSRIISEAIDSLGSVALVGLQFT